MPILERTPPVRRAPVGAETGLETSSPSRAKLDRNGGEKQVNAATNEGEYVFPPLDAMASAVREKNLGMSMNGRYTPTLSRGGENQGASGGLRGSASGGSGRRLLGAGGRNAPVLTATAAKVHPPLGSMSESKKNNTSRPSASSKNEGTPQENPQQQQQQPVRSHDYDERPIRGGAIVSIDQATSSSGTDSRAFEAQMERALASGANPFQDRKRDQMRGDSSIVVASRDSPQQQVKSPRLHSPRPMTRRMDEATPQTEMSIPLVRSPAPARKPLPSDVYNKQSTPTKARLSRPHTPDSERKREKQTLIRLQEDVAAKTLQVEKAQAEAEDAKRSLTEREKLNRQQNDRIKGLEREVKQLQIVKSKANDEDSMAKLMVISTSWEVSRISFMTGLLKAQEMRERDVEAVIYRNEVTYMDARRAEAQLELEDERIRGKELVAVVKEMKREEGRLQARVQVLQDSKEESERRKAGVQESQDELLAEIEAGKKERAAVEKELRLMKMKYEEEREKRAKAKDELLVIEKQLTKERSSQRRNRDESDEMETPIQQERKQKQKVTASTKGQHQQQQKETIEPIRQSPRKAAISAAIKSTISSVRGSSGSKQVAREEEQQQQQGMDTFDDIDVAPLAASKGAKKVVEAKKTTARQKTPTEEMDDFDLDDDSGGDDDLKTAKKPKKKSSILSRGKKPVVKEGGARGAKGKKAIDDDAEMQRQVEQTPMIVNKKKREPSVTEAEEEEEEPENSMNIDATPVVKLKAKTSKKGGGKPMQEFDEDRSLLGTRTPMVPTKRSALGAGLPQQGSIQNGNAASSSASVTAKRATTTTTEVKKKKRRLLKPNTNVANNFFSANGDEEGDLDPKLNLPLQLSPVKGGGSGGEGIMTSSSSTLLGGKKGMSAAASRVFRR